MKRVLNVLKSREFQFCVLAILVILIGYECDSEVLAAMALPGYYGGKIVSGEPLTTDVTRAESPDLLTTEIDRRITKVRPMSTPIDQLSRRAGSRKSKSMIVEYYSVDVKPGKAKLSDTYTEPTTSTVSAIHQKARLNTQDNDVFEVSETLLVQGVKGYEADGITLSKSDLVLYIYSKDENGEINVYAINGKKIGSTTDCVPTIEAGTTLIRMGRAATELDVQTGQFEALPTKDQNFCQIFKMQVEQSTFQKMASKEVNWEFNDSEEAAVYDMRLGMEKTFMFGVRRMLYDAKKKENVHLTGGIWWQAGREFEYDLSKDLTQNDIIDLMKDAFTGNGGSKRKVLIGGSNFIGRINKLEVTKIVTSNDEVVRWGLDFSEMKSKFGRLFVIFSEVFDECGMSDYGFVIDPIFITKWSHVPFGRQDLDLKKAGIRNTDAIVLTEASCLTLRYPAAHMRIVPRNIEE